MIKALCNLNNRLSTSVQDYPMFGQSRIDTADTLICLSPDGRLEHIISLCQKHTDGKIKQSLPYKLVPFQMTRSSGRFPYFLCDTPEYILGIVPKTKKLAKEKFESSAELHRKILRDVRTPVAAGILAFFDKWNPKNAFANPEICAYADLFEKQILFRVGTMDALDDKEIWQNWYEYYNASLEKPKLCAIHGEDLPAVRLHSKIKKIYGGSPSGCSLISFNNPAFESYGLKGNENANISEHAAFAYSSALNYLLSNTKSCFRMGKTTFVCWSEDGDDSYSEFFLDFLNSGPVRMDTYKLRKMMKNVSAGKLIDFDEKTLDPSSDFYILGLSPNNGRLAVTCFLHNSFGHILKNIVNHYKGLEIIGMDFPAWPYRILEEIYPQGKDKKTVPDWLSADFLGSILNGFMYPQALYSGIMGRIAADQDIKYTRAAMIKAFLHRNSSNCIIKEEVSQMELNKQLDYQPYVLGRLFAVLGRVQYNATEANSIRENYMNSACYTPAIAFPSIMLLAEKHMKKLRRDKPGLAHYFTEIINEIVTLLPDKFPSHLTLEEQGAFILGCYHQEHEMSRKKKEEDANEDN